MKIEELAQKAFENESIQPPREAWEQISTPVKRTPKLLLWITGILLVAATASLAIIIPSSSLNEGITPIEDVQHPIPMAEIQTIDIEQTESLQEVTPSINNSGMAHTNQNQLIPPPKSSSQSRGQSVVAKETSPVISRKEVQQPAKTQSIANEEQTSKVTQSSIQSVIEQNQVEESKSKQLKAEQPKSEPIPTPTITPEQVSIIIPNFISPNGDGYNDCFKLPDIETYSRVDLQIFNARGKQLFLKKDYQNDFCGEDFPAGNYFYIINFVLQDGTNVVRRGALVIER